jgi:hypothetical protein
MSKKQTRRSISMTSDTYDRLDAYCKEHQLGHSTVVEAIVRQAFGMEQNKLAKGSVKFASAAPEPEKAEPDKSAPPKWASPSKPGPARLPGNVTVL